MRARWKLDILGLVVLFVAGGAFYRLGSTGEAVTPERGPASAGPAPGDAVKPKSAYQARIPIDVSGYSALVPSLTPWEPDASLEEIAACWRGAAGRSIEKLDEELEAKAGMPGPRLSMLLMKAVILNSEGKPARAAEVLRQARAEAEATPAIAQQALYTLIYCQGVTAMRLGENENCIECRGESSCILPISEAAVHKKEAGSRAAIGYFEEYLAEFPDDMGVRWLLNVAHMTLGEHPAKVKPEHRLSIDRLVNSELDIGRFRDVGHLAGVNRLNQAGGAIMEDFDNDGRLDLMVTTFDPTESMAYYRNRGDGTFEDATESAGLAGQYGGLVCYQADYNNDGLMDVFIPRGAWIHLPVRPSLLRNDGGTFTDVTEQAGMSAPFNSAGACWADYDNDGFLDVFIACENRQNLLYRNKGDGTFEDLAGPAGVAGDRKNIHKGATWVDFDNDGAPDLFVNRLDGQARLYRNTRDGRFADVTAAMNVDGPMYGFSCWAWDYDNDGWQDIFATCYDRPLDGIVGGLIGRPPVKHSSRLFRNLRGKGFEDATREAGLEQVYAAMGTNFGDLDNDGYLDFYLGTGEPNLATLVPNRMFKNVGGRRFAEITGTSGTGHLQKGHGVAIGDWDRDGDVDLFLEMGGAIDGDKYHNILFDNPGQGNHWLTVKLVGRKTNRAAIGARIKAVAGGGAPTIHRHVTSGSSFGANPLQQTLGLGKADRVATLEIHWPTSGTTQVFRDIPADRSIEITEFAETYRELDSTPIPKPDSWFD